jgi:hypothetical protein
MRNLLALATVVFGAAVYVSTAVAAAPAGQVPFPSQTITGVFVAAETLNSDGVQASQFGPGQTVLMRAYAVDMKTHKALVGTDVKYFYATIPGQPNVRFAYDPKATGATARLPWTASWTVPANFAPGVVELKVLVKTTSKRQGQFVQLPVSASMLTVTANPTTVYKPAPSAVALAAPTMNVSLYVDSVNGTRPVGAAPRPVGCTQTNVYKRGEQFVVRSWGTDLTVGDILSTDNVDAAIATIPGQPNLTLNWGPHGVTGSQVYYWTGAWNIPTDYPLGDANIHVVFKTDDGKIGTYDYKITIIP